MHIKELFFSRTDVYARAWQTDKKGWSPKVPIFPAEFDKAIGNHLDGKTRIGTYALAQDNTCVFLAADFDDHSGDKDPLTDVRAFITAARETGVSCYLERSFSGAGYHAWLFFSQPVPGWMARRLGLALALKAGVVTKDAQQKTLDRFFPNQDAHSGAGYGNLIALPWHGQAVREGNTCFLDTETLQVIPQADFLAGVNRISRAQLEALKDFIEAQGVTFTPGESKAAPSEEPAAGGSGTARLEKVLECNFLVHCREHAADLSEPLWYDMCTNLANFPGGGEAIHRLSAIDTRRYNREDTDKKISQAVEALSQKGFGPHTCEKIKEHGFSCPRLGECEVKAPAGLGRQKHTLEELAQILAKIEPAEGNVAKLNQAKEFIRFYLLDQDDVIAETFIEEDLAEHLGLKKELAKKLKKDLRAARQEVNDNREQASASLEDTPLWRIIDGIIAFRRKGDPAHQLTDKVIEWFTANGAEFYRDSIAGSLYLFFKNSLVEIGNNLPFTAFLQQHGKINAVTAEGRQIIQALRDHAYVHGNRISSGTGIYQDKAKHVIYVNLNNDNNELLRIAPEKIERIRNGLNDEKVLLAPSRMFRELEYDPNVSVEEGIGLFKSLFLDNLTCPKADRFLFGAWVLAVFLRGYATTKPLMKLSGSSDSGKTTAANLATTLLYGISAAQVASSAALYSAGTRDPLLVLDNLESVNLRQDIEQFLLTSATGISKLKRKTGSDSDTVEERVDALVLITAIEPLAKTELINRTYDIMFHAENKRLDFIADDVLTQLTQARSKILSAVFKLISDEILPLMVNGLRTNYMKGLNETPWAKSRTNEYLALMIMLDCVVNNALDPASREVEYDENANWVKWIESLDADNYDTEKETNINLMFIEYLVDDLQNRNGSTGSDYLVKAIVKNEFSDVKEVLGFTGTAKQIHISFATLAKAKGLKYPYTTPKQLIYRLQDSKALIESQNWFVDKGSVVHGEQRWVFVRREESTQESTPQSTPQSTP